MTKLTTADIQNWLASNREVQLIVESRFGDPVDGDPEWNAYCHKSTHDATIPKKWVRQRKYSVGSPTDMETGIRLGEGLLSQPLLDLTNGVVREFWLKDTDHVTVLTVEKNGKIVFIEDLSD